MFIHTCFIKYRKIILKVIYNNTSVLRSIDKFCHLLYKIIGKHETVHRYIIYIFIVKCKWYRINLFLCHNAYADFLIISDTFSGTLKYILNLWKLCNTLKMLITLWLRLHIAITSFKHIFKVISLKKLIWLLIKHIIYESLIYIIININIYLYFR